MRTTPSRSTRTSRFDTDGDGTGNNADADDDGDGQTDADESDCGSDPLLAASKSPDNDGDHRPDCVDADDDSDGVLDGADNCPLVANAGQLDTDKDGAGDDCDADGVYKFRVLYDPTKAHKSGGTIPVKLQVTDLPGMNLSAPGLVVNAVAVHLVGQAYGEVQDSGNANPDMNFRYDPALGGAGGGYIFNLKTTGLAPGTYLLYFRIGADPYLYATPFQVR